MPLGYTAKALDPCYRTRRCAWLSHYLSFFRNYSPGILREKSAVRRGRARGSSAGRQGTCFRSNLARRVARRAAPRGTIVTPRELVPVGALSLQEMEPRASNQELASDALGNWSGLLFCLVPLVLRSVALPPPLTCVRWF